MVGFTAAFDKSSNKFYERELHAESRSHLYQPFDAAGVVEGGYDSINRLRQYQRGVLSSTGGFGGNGGGAVTTPITLPDTDNFRDYDLDGLGNWHTTDYTPVGGSDTTDLRQHNKLNQITTRKIDSDPKTAFAYDGAPGSSNGNLADGGVRSYEWDALNRLITVTRDSDSAQIAEYTYDALNRRIRKVVTNGGLPGDSGLNGTTVFLYNSRWQCVEERNGSFADQKQYVWGTYIDELVQQHNIVTIHGLSGDLYPLQDLLYRTTVLTDSSGDIVEAYDTDAYGNTLIYNSAGTGGDWWADDAVQTNDPTNDFIFTGRRFDPESEIYYYRNRYYDPMQGRFISKDPMGYVDGNNLYLFVDNCPTTHRDPYGDTCCCDCKCPGGNWSLGKGMVIITGLFVASFTFNTTASCDTKPSLTSELAAHGWGGGLVAGAGFRFVGIGWVTGADSCEDLTSPTAARTYSIGGLGASAGAMYIGGFGKVKFSMFSAGVGFSIKKIISKPGVQVGGYYATIKCIR